MKRNNFTVMLLSALLLAGCGGAATSSTSTAAPVEGKTINLTYSGTASDQTFNEGLFEEFKAARKAAGDPNTYNIAYEAAGIYTKSHKCPFSEISGHVSGGDHSGSPSIRKNYSGEAFISGI